MSFVQEIIINNSNSEEDTETEPALSPAERMYANHRRNVAAYQLRNPEKMRTKTKKYLDKIKTDNPEKWDDMKRKKKEYYLSVVKPKRQAERALNL
jgi:hypothetical protein